jgi:hypothetical protein
LISVSRSDHTTERIHVALGDQRTTDRQEVLMLAFTWAMLEAGMGHFDFAGVMKRMASGAWLIADDSGPEAAS